MNAKSATCSVFAGIALLTSGPAAAEKIPDAFRSEFQKTINKSSYAVVVREKIPTTSVYGVEGGQTEAYFSIDIVAGSFKPSGGLLDTDQVIVDTLNRGEVMEVVDVTFKDNRIDLRCVSVESRKVTRSDLFLKDEKREPVSTNFKFFLPTPEKKVLTVADVPAVLSYIKAYLEPFPSEQEARAYSLQVASGQASTAGPTKKKDIRAGMTTQEVLDALGKPTEELTFGNKTKWAYPALTVIFEDGKVTDVKF